MQWRKYNNYNIIVILHELKKDVRRRAVMFILSLKYIKPLEEVDKELKSHIQYLEKYYSLQKFICSGRRNPRIGGVILCNVKNMEEVKSIINEDPFYINKIAEYEIIEFTPTKYADGFEDFIS